jgi:hypothetical protein
MSMHLTQNTPSAKAGHHSTGDATAVVDLHGYPASQALDLAAEAVERAWNDQRKFITLIHGAPDVGHWAQVNSAGRGSIKWGLRGALARGEWGRFVYSRKSNRHRIDAGSMTLALRPFAVSDEEFVLGWEPTSTATEKDVEESRRLAVAIKAVKSQCWFNARKAVLRLDDYAEASYVEGWALVGGVMEIEHGWVVRGEMIIDPTLPEDDITYIAGLEFSGRSGIEEFLKTPQGRRCKNTPFFFAFGWGGHKSPSFARAARECRECCKHFALEATEG